MVLEDEIKLKGIKVAKELSVFRTKIKRNKIILLGFVILNTLCVVISTVLGSWGFITFMNVLAVIVCLKVYFMATKALKEIDLDDTRKDI